VERGYSASERAISVFHLTQNLPDLQMPPLPTIRGGAPSDGIEAGLARTDLPMRLRCWRPTAAWTSPMIGSTGQQTVLPAPYKPCACVLRRRQGGAFHAPWRPQGAAWVRSKIASRSCSAAAWRAGYLPPRRVVETTDSSADGFFTLPQRNKFTAGTAEFIAV